MNTVALHEPETQRRDVARFPSVNTGFFDLHSFELMQRVARGFTASSLVPAIYRGLTPEALGNCMIALNLAQRMKADPLMVMQNLTIIQGRPTWSSQFLIATVNTCGRFTALRFEFFGERDTDQFGCRAWATEKATGEKLVGADITINLAKAEGWYGRSGSKWKTMAQQMLIYRCGAWWTRAYAPELSMGLLTADEVEDIIDLEPSAYRDVTPAKGRSRNRAALPANDTAGEETPPADKVEDDPRLDAAQVAVLLKLVTEAGVNIDKVYKWAGVTAFTEIPANRFEHMREKHESKLSQSRTIPIPEQSPSPADTPPPAGQTPATPPGDFGSRQSAEAGEPASSVLGTVADDVRRLSQSESAEGTPDPLEEVRQAGRKACRAGLPFESVPRKYAYLTTRPAWEEGYQAEAEFLEAEARQDAVEQEFADEKDRRIGQLKKDMRQDG